MKKIIALLALPLFAACRPAYATAPICMYQDVQSGPATGGEGGNGVYLNIYGLNFGSATVTVNGVPVAQYVYRGADPTGERQQIGVQIAAATTGSGSIVVTTPGGSCSNLGFTVTAEPIYFIGPANDTSAPPSSCADLLAGNSYGTPYGLDMTDGPNAPDTSAPYRTPYTYLNCIPPPAVVVLLDGTSWPYYDGRGWHASLTVPNNETCTDTSFYTVMARPGASVSLGNTVATAQNPTGYSYKGVVDLCEHSVISGLSMSGATYGGTAFSSSEGDAALWARSVGNVIQCPTCDGSDGALDPGDGTNAYVSLLGNVITNVSTNVNGGAGSSKEFHPVYVSGSNFEFAWNKIYATQAYNGVQVNHDGVSGFYNFAIHDNDIMDVNGSGVNLATIDPSSGYVQVYNNVIHHTGLARSYAGSSDDPHNCVAVKGSGTATGAGVVYVWGNTMFDCSSILNSYAQGEGESGAVQVATGQPSVTTNLVDNIVYQPAYTYTGNYNVFFANDGANGAISGSNNVFYSAAAPASTVPATSYGVIEDPLLANSIPCSPGCPVTNYELQPSSPAVGTGLRVGPVESQGASSDYLTWDFPQDTRPNPPAIGAFEPMAVAPPTGLNAFWWSIP